MEIETGSKDPVFFIIATKVESCQIGPHQLKQKPIPFLKDLSFE